MQEQKFETVHEYGTKLKYRLHAVKPKGGNVEESYSRCDLLLMMFNTKRTFMGLFYTYIDRI